MRMGHKTSEGELVSSSLWYQSNWKHGKTPWLQSGKAAPCEKSDCSSWYVEQTHTHTDTFVAEVPLPGKGHAFVHFKSSHLTADYSYNHKRKKMGKNNLLFNQRLLNTLTQRTETKSDEKLGQSHSPVSYSVAPSSHSLKISHTAWLCAAQCFCDNDDYQTPNRHASTVQQSTRSTKTELILPVNYTCIFQRFISGMNDKHQRSDDLISMSLKASGSTLIQTIHCKQPQLTFSSNVPFPHSASSNVIPWISGLTLHWDSASWIPRKQRTGWSEIRKEMHRPETMTITAWVYLHASINKQKWMDNKNIDTMSNFKTPEY